jgi:alpha-galactosidase
MLPTATLSLALLAAPIWALPAEAGSRVPLDVGWKLQLGDDSSWSAPDLDDTRWRSVDPDQPWELQGYAAYNGYAWYRIHVVLPSALRERSFLKDDLQVAVGLIDDSDQTFLNGVLIGQNGTSVARGTAPTEPFEGGRQTYRRRRVYRLGANDPCVRWDAENVIAIRVHDHGGAGGLYGGPRFIGMVDLDDVVVLDADHAPFEILPNDRYRKTLRIRNEARLHDFAGELRVTAEPITAEGTRSAPAADIRQQVVLHSGQTQTLPFELRIPQREPHVVRYAFVEQASGRVVVSSQEVPWILTPDRPLAPRINGPGVLGARPGAPFVFRIPVSGRRPIAVAARDLPAGLRLDPKTGVVRGSVATRGRYDLKIEAQSSYGSDTRTLRLVVGDTLALTPPLTWSTWRRWGLQVSDPKVREAAGLLVSSGLADHGWSYVAIDDGWQAPERDAAGRLQANAHFPDMGALAESIHAQGLRMGLYASPGPRTCGGLPGTFGHEQLDARLWASWGVDLVEYGWCTYGDAQGEPRGEALKRPFALMGSLLEHVGRDVVYSINQYGWAEVWKWADDARAQVWHTDTDDDEAWQGVIENGFADEAPALVVRPGYWRNPGALGLGWLSWGDEARPSRLTVSEQYAQVSQWALLAAPLTLSCDLARLDAFTLSLLTNDEVLAVDEDPLGRPAHKALDRDGVQVWIRPLADGARAVGVFNMRDVARTVEVSWQDVGLTGSEHVRDLWRQQDLESLGAAYTSLLTPHGVALLRTVPGGAEGE